MRILEILQQRFGFTRNELIIVGLLCAGLMAGTAVRSFRETPAGQRLFPYAATDSAFLRGAQAFHHDLRAHAETSGSHAAPAIVNINEATAAELIALPGIGPAMAGRILAWRSAHGRFARIDDLDRVKGIGPATVKRLRPLIRIGSPSPGIDPDHMTHTSPEKQ